MSDPKETTVLLINSHWDSFLQWSRPFSSIPLLFTVLSSNPRHHPTTCQHYFYHLIRGHGAFGFGHFGATKSIYCETKWWVTFVYKLTRKPQNFKGYFCKRYCVLCKDSAARSAQSEGSVDPLKCATHLILPRCITNTWPKVNFSSFSRSLSVRHFMGHFSRITYGF